MAAFGSLSDRLNDTFDRLRGKGKLTEADINVAMREIRMALLEADVNFKVVKDFVASTKERCLTSEVMDSLTPAQNVVKIVLDELTELLGSTESKLVFSSRIPNVIMLVGLQGSGKTTAAVKLAYLLKKQGRSPLLAACDVYRPAAADQLATLGGEIGVPVFRGDGAHPIEIAQGAVREAVDKMRDVVIVDTAGRLQIDEQMMQEAVDIKKAVKPDQVLMVVDAMTGQDIVNVVSTFAERTDFDGVIISKLDGDARGGGGAVDVAGGEQRALALLLEQVGELHGSSRLTGALQAHKHDDIGDTARKHELALGGPKELDELIEHDLHDVLRRGERIHDLGREAALLGLGNEVLHDLEVDVRLEERHTDVAHRARNVGLGELALAAQAVKGIVQAVGEVVEHGGSYRLSTLRVGCMSGHLTTQTVLAAPRLRNSR